VTFPSIPRRLAALAAMCTLALALSTAPALAAKPGSDGIPVETGPLSHVTVPVADLGSAFCGPAGERVYLFTTGDVILTFRTDVYSDYGLAIEHFTITHGQATSGGTTYRVVGGETHNDLAGRLNLNVMFLGPSGGVVDRATFVMRQDSHGGAGFYVDHGTCGV
jgi:hypothetical protein